MGRLERNTGGMPLIILRDNEERLRDGGMMTGEVVV